MLNLVRLKDKNINLIDDIKEFDDPEFIYIKNNNKYKLNQYIYKGSIVNDEASSISGHVKSLDTYPSLTVLI